MPWRARERDPDAERLYESVGRQIATQRAARNLSQAELAELCGTTQSAIARAERSTRPPRIDTLMRIANALDCDLRVELAPRTKVRGKRDE